MQSTTFAFQAFQVARFGGLLLGAIAMARFGAPDVQIDRYESMLLIGSTCTFFWLGGLLDGFLLVQKKSNPLHASGILNVTTRWMAILSLGSSMAGLLAALWFYPWIGSAFAGLFVGYWALETMCQLFPYAMLAKERPVQLLAYGIFHIVGYTLSIAIPLVIGADFLFILASLLVFGIVRIVWMATLLWPDARRSQVEPGSSRQIWLIGAPLMLATLLSQSAVYVDGYLVQEFFPDSFVDFRYGAKEFPLVLLLANSLSIVKAGEIAAGHRTGGVAKALAGLRSGSSRLMWTMFPMSIVLLVISGPVFEWAFQHRFPMAVPIFDLFLLLAVPRLMFPQSVVRGYHKTFAMSFSSGIELVLNLGLSLLLMQFWGLPGIAAGTVIAYFAEKVVLLVFTRVKLGVAWGMYAPIPLWTAWSLALLGAWAIKYLL